ncbi:MAG: endopeptidase La [Clostridia bacterium]|nr:endopeptidase La [Clostridia bacterium]
MAVLPLYNALVLPDANVYLKNERFEKMTGRAPKAEERVTLLILRDDLEREQLTQDSFYPIGVSGTVSEVHDEGWFVVRARGRVNLDEIAFAPDGRIEAYTSRREDGDVLSPQEDARKTAAAKSALMEFSRGTQWEAASKPWLDQFDTLSDVAAACAPWMDATHEEKYAILREDSAVKRAEMLEKLIYETLEMGKLSQEGSSARQEDYQKMVRESAIKKQMEYLQKELDEMHPENVSDIRRLELKIQESGMNDTARREADKLLNRLKQEGANGAETGMLYNYLDFLTSLSWKKEPAREIDLDEAERVLEEDHFGLKKVKDRILQQIAVMNLKKRQSGSILLFVGAPGTGKTSIGQSIAKALQRQYVRVSLGGVRDEADIRGHRRTYIGAMPGRIMDAVQKSGVSNPVMVLDEVDKLSMSYNGDPASALLEVLDPEQNSTFTDHYMNVPYDLSDVLFICTANTADTIPEPLLNRMEVIQFQGYTPIEKRQIALRHLLPKAMEAVGVTQEQLSVSEEAVQTIIADYTREGGVRGLKKRMDTLCRSAAVRIVRGQSETLRVTPDNLREYLDMRPMRHRSVRENGVPGIVTGLAWTAAGGDILYIETMLTRGSGQIVITGQLGDVMKESARLAISLVKHRFPERAAAFADHDLHIHVPDGATPKDGPSAGITLTCAIASLIMGKPVDPAIAMTGEISLRGEVTPIGGLPEKLMAAQRAGVRQVLIPVDNEDDLQDVAKEVLEQLKIVPIRDLDEALALCGIGEESPVARAV